MPIGEYGIKKSPYSSIDDCNGLWWKAVLATEKWIIISFKHERQWWFFSHVFFEAAWAENCTAKRICEKRTISARIMTALISSPQVRVPKSVNLIMCLVVATFIFSTFKPCRFRSMHSKDEENSCYMQYHLFSFFALFIFRMKWIPSSVRSPQRYGVIKSITSVC